MSLQKDLDTIRAEIKRVAEDSSIDEINANAILDKKAKEIGFESWSKLEPVYDQYADAGFQVDEKNIISSAISGLTFGWSDEIEAAAIATKDSLFGNADWGEAFDKRLAKERAGQQAFRQLKPGQDIAGEVIGGFIPTAIALLATPFTGGASLGALTAAQGARVGFKQLAKRGAKVGTGVGALSGAGYAEGTGDKVLGGVIGAGVGGTLGAALPTLGAGIGRTIGMLRSTPVQGFSKDEQKALKQISNAFAKDEISPEEVIKQIQINVDADKLVGQTPIEVLADFGGEAVRRKLGAARTLAPEIQADQRLLSRTSGTGEQKAEAIVSGIEPNIQSSRIMAGVEEASKSIRTKGINLKSGIDDISEAMQQKVNPLYDKTFNNPNNTRIKDFKIYDFINENPEIKNSYKKAIRPYQLQAEANGRVPQRIPGSFDDVIKLDKNGNIVEILEPLPLEFLDQIKRLSDEKIFSNVKLKGLSKRLANLQKGPINEYRDLLKKYADGDEYKLALSNASDKLSLNSAFDDGVKMSKSAATSDQFKTAINKLSSPAEKDAFRVGVFQQMQEDLLGTKDNIDLVKKLWDSPKLRSKLNALFEGDETALKAFVDKLKREAKIQLTASKVTGGSQTADKAQDAINLQRLLTDMAVSGAGSETTQRPIFEYGAQSISKLLTSKPEQVGDLLLNQSPRRQQEILRAMEELRKSAQGQITAGQNIGAQRGSLAAATIPGLFSD
jgi:hypothetical protein